MKKGRFVLLLAAGFLLVTLSAPQQAVAADNVWDMAQSDQYGRKAMGQLGRGLLNAASCFVDLAVQTVEKTQEGPAVVGTLAGIGSGAGCTILRAGSGILDVATFWIPDFRGIPVSRSYSNCLEKDSRFYSEAAPVYAGNEGYQQPVASVAPAPVVQQAAPAPQPVRDASTYIKGDVPGAKHDPGQYIK